MKKETIGVIFGGRSGEHEVSVITGHQIMDALTVAGYGILPIYISKDGSWFAGSPLHNLKLFQQSTFNPSYTDNVHRVSLSPDPSVRQLVLHPDVKLGLFKKSPVLWADVFLPAVHGTFGEDGTLQGLLEMADVPYVGAGVLASAVAMDKVISKRIFSDYGLPTLPCISFSRSNWEESQDKIISQIESFEKYPVICKPVTLGSSIGVKRCNDRKELVLSLAAAFKLDENVLIERALEDFFEVNCSVMGPPIKTSVCEQPVSQGAVLSFEDKYKSGGKGSKGKNGGSDGAKGSGMASLKRLIPAPISEELAKEIQTLAAKAFEATNSSGVARIDFLVCKKENKLYVNEMNNPPGSFAFYLWEASKLPFDKLVTELVEIAKKRHRAKKETLFSFEANLLQS
jgi:D-alanine-D-alanine ligase